jgi:N-methylhydantoinase A
VEHRVAVDIGGTFTDLVVEAPGQPARVSKVLSTPHDLVQGVVQAVEAAEVPLDQSGLFIHGTTSGLNTLLERRGARVALITTRGFRDVYLIGRGHRPDMYDLRYRKPAPLLDRDAIFELEERVAADGEELIPVDRDELEVVAKAIAEGGFEAVAVCLVHAYVQPRHELEVREHLRGMLEDTPVLLSHETAPEWREYERTSTVVTSAYITPKVQSYLQRIREALAERGLQVPLHITQSNGGAMRAEVAADRAVLTLFSGPVGGVVGGREIGRELETANLICVDMGGTSFDVSLVRDGEVGLQSEFELQGLPILAPAVELVTIGAGGGSIIHVEHGGLRVGPKSAGSAPGPACYGNGGAEPTVSDANLVLGRLPRAQRLAGSMELDLGAAQAAMRQVGDTLGLSERDLAEQALEVTHFAMAEAIRELTVERGLHPKDFGLAAFGGAGPLHAAFLADELEIDRVVIPAHSGAFSAWGMLQGDIRHDVVTTFYRRFEDASHDLPPVIEALRADVVDVLRQEAGDTHEVRFETSVELRYVGQEYSLLVALPGTTADDALAAAFHAAYQQRYGHSNPAAPIEFVAVRLAGIVAFPHAARGRAAAAGASAPIAEQEVVFGGEAVLAPVYVREAINREVSGPAIVIEPSTTTVVPPGWRIGPSTGAHLLMTREQKDER